MGIRPGASEPREKGDRLTQQQLGVVSARAGLTRTPLETTLARGRKALLGLQDEAGWWNGEDEANQTLDAQYIFLFHYTGLLERPEYQEKARKLGNWIRRTQRQDGTWAIYHGAPGCLSPPRSHTS